MYSRLQLSLLTSIYPTQSCIFAWSMLPSANILCSVFSLYSPYYLWPWLLWVILAHIYILTYSGLESWGSEDTVMGPGGNTIYSGSNVYTEEWLIKYTHPIIVLHTYTTSYTTPEVHKTITEKLNHNTSDSVIYAATTIISQVDMEFF